MSTPDEDDRTRVAELYGARGLGQPWERVWREGVDVTAEDPSTWLPPWSRYITGKRGERERAYWLGKHAEAVAALDGGGDFLHGDMG